MLLLFTSTCASVSYFEICGHHPSESLGFTDTECVDVALNEVIWSSWPAINGSSQSENKIYSQ